MDGTASVPSGSGGCRRDPKKDCVETVMRRAPVVCTACNILICSIHSGV